jgi:hypothetical protein
MTTYEELGSSNINGWNFTWPGGGAFDHSIMYTDMLPGDTANMSFSGTAKYTYKWLDGNGNPAANPPAKVYIKEWSFAEWCAIIGGYSLTPLSAAGQADGGLMDAYVGSSSEGPTFRGGQTTSYSTPHLVQVDGSSGTIERTVNVSANATASISQYSYGGNLSADFNYGVDIDTRGVTLTRDGAHGETIDSDGTVHGDTTFSYYDESWTSSGDYSVHHNNWQTFHPFFVGNWTRKWDPQQGDIEDVTWNWDPFATGDTQDTGNWSMCRMRMVMWVGRVR